MENNDLHFRVIPEGWNKLLRAMTFGVLNRWINRQTTPDFSHHLEQVELEIIRLRDVP